MGKAASVAPAVARSPSGPVALRRAARRRRRDPRGTHALLAEYHALLDEMGKLPMPSFRAEDLVAEMRGKGSRCD